MISVEDRNNIQKAIEQALMAHYRHESAVSGGECQVTLTVSYFNLQGIGMIAGLMGSAPEWIVDIWTAEDYSDLFAWLIDAYTDNVHDSTGLEFVERLRKELDRVERRLNGDAVPSAESTRAAQA